MLIICGLIVELIRLLEAMINIMNIFVALGASSSVRCKREFGCKASHGKSI